MQLFAHVVAFFPHFKLVWTSFPSEWRWEGLIIRHVLESPFLYVSSVETINILQTLGLCFGHWKSLVRFDRFSVDMSFFHFFVLSRPTGSAWMLLYGCVYILTFQVQMYVYDDYTQIVGHILSVRIWVFKWLSPEAKSRGLHGSTHFLVTDTWPGPNYIWSNWVGVKYSSGSKLPLSQLWLRGAS